MRTSVALVHDDPSFTENAVAALERAGFHVVVFSDPMAALDQIENLPNVDTLITRMTFPRGKPNGVSLALVLRTKMPHINVVFVARAGYERHASGVGIFIPQPADFGKLVEAVRTRLVSS